MIYLDEHIKRYPLMEINDKIKLIFQGILGPGHLIDDKKLVLSRIENEYLAIKNNSYHYELIEEISDDFVRVYLKPFYEKFGCFNSLIEAFYLSTKEPVDINVFIKEIESLIDSHNIEYIMNYLNNGNWMISHSLIYKKNYHPHYLVIHKKYLNVLGGKYEI